nr:ATP-binding cassette domain-containing protein [Candidatus Sigynarchaeota archaeon]
MSQKWLIKLEDVTISYKISRQLAKKYRTKRIFTPLTRINLTVNDKDFISISGPNGSGKTSLLKIMSGLMRPFKGTVLWQAFNFGFVSQQQILLPELTIKENILLPFYVGHEREKHNGAFDSSDEVDSLFKRLDNYVVRFNIENILEKSPKTCSIGQQQRALLVRALTLDRDIIFGDEAEQNLDADGRVELFESFREANRAFGKTIVLVSQEHPDVLKRYVTRSVKIKAGNLVDIYDEDRESLVAPPQS